MGSGENLVSKVPATSKNYPQTLKDAIQINIVEQRGNFGEQLGGATNIGERGEFGEFGAGYWQTLAAND